MASLQNPPSFWSDLGAKLSGGLVGQLRAPYRAAKLKLDMQAADRADEMQKQQQAEQAKYDKETARLRADFLKVGIPEAEVDAEVANVRRAADLADAAIAKNARERAIGMNPMAKETGAMEGLAGLKSASAAANEQSFRDRLALAKQQGATDEQLAEMARRETQTGLATAGVGAKTAMAKNKVLTDDEAVEQAKLDIQAAAERARAQLAQNREIQQQEAERQKERSMEEALQLAPRRIAYEVAKLGILPVPGGYIPLNDKLDERGRLTLGLGEATYMPAVVNTRDVTGASTPGLLPRTGGTPQFNKDPLGSRTNLNIQPQGRQPGKRYYNRSELQGP